jgi:hypothetical protein
VCVRQRPSGACPLLNVKWSILQSAPASIVQNFHITVWVKTDLNQVINWIHRQLIHNNGCGLKFEARILSEIFRPASQSVSQMTHVAGISSNDRERVWENSIPFSSCCPTWTSVGELSLRNCVEIWELARECKRSSSNFLSVSHHFSICVRFFH